MQMHKIHSDQTQTSGQSLLKNSTILQAEGADAATFLQGQFSQDVNKLSDKTACFAGLSNPKGRLIVTVYIYKKTDNIFWLVIPTSMLSETQKQLTKYVMRSKVKFSLAEDLYLYGLWNKSQENLSKFEDTFKLAEHAKLSIGISKNKIMSESDDEAAWSLQKILNVIPEVNPQTQEHFVAQMLNMDVLNGISFNKGCYTGQEIIARMQHLGRIKRRTVLIKSLNKLVPGEKIKYKDSSFGEVINCFSNEEEHYSLAVVQMDKVKEFESNKLLNDYGFVIYGTPYNLEQDV